MMNRIRRAARSLVGCRGLVFMLLLVVVVGCGRKADSESKGRGRSKLMPGSNTEAGRDEGTGQDDGHAAIVDAAEMPPTHGGARPDLRGTGAGPFALQLGSFLSPMNADTQAGRIRALGYEPAVEVAVLGGETYHRVFVYGMADPEAARLTGEKIRAELGITYLVRKVD